jgi:hypothetical protein
MIPPVIRFQLRRIPAVLIVRERGGAGWLTLVSGHGWVFGSLAEARHEARWLANNFGGLPVREAL